MQPAIKYKKAAKGLVSRRLPKSKKGKSPLSKRQPVDKRRLSVVIPTAVFDAVSLAASLRNMQLTEFVVKALESAASGVSPPTPKTDGSSFTTKMSEFDWTVAFLEEYIEDKKRTNENTKS